MKNKKLAVALATIMLGATVVSGCGKKPSDDENTLEIYATSSGYGHKWIEEMISAFEAQNPDCKVVFNYDIGVELCGKKVLAGPSGNTADLLFTQEDWFSTVMKGDKAVSGYAYALEDITDIVTEQASDGTSIKDNMRKEYIAACAMEMETSEGEYEDRYYFLPLLLGYNGITYNKTLFDAHSDWEMPRTTDELIALCDTIKGEGIIPLVNEVKTGYIDSLTMTLFAQYMGAEEYHQYMMPVSEEDYIYYTATGSSKASLYSMYVMDDLLNPAHGRLSKTATEDDYGRAQGRLIAGEGAMEIIGSWFDNEMALSIKQANEAGKAYESGMMSMPVISALSDQLSYWNKIMPENTDYQFAKNGVAEGENLGKCDELLAKIVEYVDNGKVGELPSIVFEGETITATQSDVVRVEEARKIYSGSVGNNMVIPSYAKGKEWAKKFVKFLYSKEGAEIVFEHTNGGCLPMNYDKTAFASYAQASNYQKQVVDLLQKGTAIMGKYDYSWRISGLPLPTSKFYSYALTDSKYVSPETYFQQNALTKEKFLELMKSSGLL